MGGCSVRCDGGRFVVTDGDGRQVGYVFRARYSVYGGQWVAVRFESDSDVDETRFGALTREGALRLLGVEPSDDALVSEYADAVMGLIHDDVLAGFVPVTAASFSELHDHVDANEYVLQVMGADAFDVALANRVTDDVDSRLRSRGGVRCRDCGTELGPGIGEEAGVWRTVPGGRYFCGASLDALHHPAV